MNIDTSSSSDTNSILRTTPLRSTNLKYILYNVYNYA